MIRPKAKHFLFVLGGILLSLIIMVSVAAVMVMRAPVSVAFAKPTVQSAFANAFAPLTLDFRDPTIVWVGEERAFRLNVRRVEVYGEGDVLVAEVPQAEIGISLGGLLRGMIAPSWIEFSGATTLVIRRLDGSLQLGLSTQTSTARTSDEPPLGIAEAILGLLASEPDPSTQAGYLRGFSISGSTLRFFDAQTNSFWRAPDARLSFARSTEGLSIELDAGVEVGGRLWSLDIAGVYNPAQERGTVAAQFSDLNPSHIAITVPALSALQGVDLPIRGAANMVVTGQGEILSADLSIVVGSGEFALPGFFDDPVPVDSAAFVGSFNVKEQMIQIRRLTYQADDNRLALIGAVSVETDEVDTWRPVAFDFNGSAEDVSIMVPSVQDRPVVYERFSANIRADARTQTLSIRNFDGLSEGATIALSGEISAASGELEAYLSGTATNVPGRSILAYWPRDRGLGARDWINDNLFTGVATEASFVVNAPPGSLATLPLPAEILDVQFTFEDASAEFIPELPYLTGAYGTGRLTAHEFELNVEGARVNDIILRSGRMYMGTLYERGSPGVFDLDVEGPVSQIVGLLDMGPFDYPSQYGIEPSILQGRASGTLNLSLPMLRRPPLETIDFTADARVTGFGMAELAAGVDLTDGTLDVHLDRSYVSAGGDVLLNGVEVELAWRENFGQAVAPSTYSVNVLLTDSDRVRLGIDFGSAVTGPVPVDITARGHGRTVRYIDVSADLRDATVLIPRTEWIKPAGESATAQLSIELPPAGGVRISELEFVGDRAQIVGDFALGANGRLEFADLSRIWLEGLIDVEVAASREDGETLVLDINGPYFNAGPFVAEFTRSENQGPGLPFRVNGYVADLEMLKDVHVTNVSLALQNDGTRVTDLTFAGGLASGGVVQAAMGPGAGSTRSFLATSDNAGELMKGLVGFEDVAGGRLVLDVSVRDVFNDVEESPDDESAVLTTRTEGTLSVDQFRVVRAPVLAQMLSLISLQGLADTLNGEGISFQELDLPFYADGGVLGFESGRAHGSALGLTLDGILDRDENIANLSGTIVPAYDINSFLGNLPVLGEVFVSREGEGVIAFTYSIVGPADNPQVIVNPLAALTPGLFRRIFSGNPPQQTITQPQNATQESVPEETTPDSPAPEESQDVTPPEEN